MECVAEKRRQYRHAPDNDSGGLLGKAAMLSAPHQSEIFFTVHTPLAPRLSTPPFDSGSWPFEPASRGVQYLSPPH